MVRLVSVEKSNDNDGRYTVHTRSYFLNYHEWLIVVHSCESWFKKSNDDGE